MKKLDRSAGALMLATLASRLLGFVRIGIISYLFGAQAQADIIHLVYSIPNNLRKLLAEGALSTAFIPVLSQSMLEDQNARKLEESRGATGASGATGAGGSWGAGRPRNLEKSRRLVENLFAFQFIVLSPFLLFSSIFPEIVLRFFLNFQDAETLESAAGLFRYVVHYIVLVSFSAIIMAVLNSNNEFIIPGFTPVLFSIAVISSLLLFYRQLGIYAMAVGVLLGGFVQFAFQLPKFLRLGYRFSFNYNFNNPHFKRILRNCMPIFCSSAIFVINQQIAFRFASAMEAGSASALSNAIVFWQLPYGIFSASIITVLYPKMSKYIAEGKHGELAQTIGSGMSALVTFLIPASLFLMIMGHELISTALQRGNFLAENTALAAEVLYWYSPGLVFVALNALLQRLYFSNNDTRTPIINAVIITVLDIILTLWLKDTVLGVRGIALANTLSYGIAFFWFLFQAKKRFGDILLRPVLIDIFKIAIALIPACLIMIAGRSILGNYWELGSSFLNLMKFLAVSVPAAGSVLLMFVLLRLEAVYMLIRKRK